MSDMLPVPTQSNAAALKERGTEEVRRRKVGEDPRRQVFLIQHKLLSQLEPKFGQMYLDDVENFLRSFHMMTAGLRFEKRQ